MGNFAQNRLRPLGATQNWQNARYNAAATHAAMISRNEVVPGVSKADAAQKETISAVIPRKADKTTIERRRAFLSGPKDLMRGKIIGKQKGVSEKGERDIQEEHLLLIMKVWRA